MLPKGVKISCEYVNYAKYVNLNIYSYLRHWLTLAQHI
jgi:hypothetical protein